ncbi:MAG: RpiB/LacA/LacB family sugar-phosphate isomerase [Candidatus Doudnabacteria bacterium]|nr:RpiB/LacA/LacB family sugar-phosphate isomerase [Candidatus Doudnabacteria bacterium]
MIYIASDHTGFEMKEGLKEYLLLRGYKVKDLGPQKKDRVKYPEFAKNVGRAVVAEVNSRGILISGTGAGMCIAANKVKKIRASVVFNEELAEKTRMEDNANMLCLPSNFIALELAKNIVGTWLSTSFSGVDYYVECNKMIGEIENNEH